MGTKIEYYVQYEEYRTEIDDTGADCLFMSGPFADYEKAKQEYITLKDDESTLRKNVCIIRKRTIVEVIE